MWNAASAKSTKNVFSVLLTSTTILARRQLIDRKISASPRGQGAAWPRLPRLSHFCLPLPPTETPPGRKPSPEPRSWKGPHRCRCGRLFHLPRPVSGAALLPQCRYNRARLRQMSACGRLDVAPPAPSFASKGIVRCGIGYSQPRRLPRSCILFFYNRGTWIQPESPNRGTDYEEAGCNNEWRLPRSELNQNAKDNWRQGAAKVSRHIHHA